MKLFTKNSLFVALLLFFSSTHSMFNDLNQDLTQSNIHLEQLTNSLESVAPIVPVLPVEPQKTELLTDKEKKEFSDNLRTMIQVFDRTKLTGKNPAYLVLKGLQGIINKKLPGTSPKQYEKRSAALSTLTNIWNALQEDNLNNTQTYVEELKKLLGLTEEINVQKIRATK